MSPRRRAKPETSRFAMTNLDDTNRGCRTGARKTRAWPPTDPTKTCSDHPLRSLDSPSPHNCIVILVQVGTESCACRRTPCPSPFQYPVSYLVLSYHDHRLYTAVRLLLLYYTVVTALLCAAVTSDPPVRFGPLIGPTPYMYDAKQVSCRHPSIYPADSPL